MSDPILIVAFHFPPVATSSGVQRALKLVRYLREDRWCPIVLTVQPRAHSRTDPGQLREIPTDVPVHRTFGLDATRHLAVRGRYPGLLALPDPWSSWCPLAIRTGKKLIRKHKPRLIWSTFPISSANLVALRLAKWSGVPWVADLRDPMTLDGYPADPKRFRAVRSLEKSTIDQATRVVFTAEYTRQLYIERYPELGDKAILMPNGYDEENFPTDLISKENGSKRLTLLHSGALQPGGRNPASFFTAIGRLKRAGKISAQDLQIVFRASGFMERYAKRAKEAGIEDLVHFKPALPYDDALAEMVNADALLLFQGTSYNHAVPAKLYEYLFARRPVLGILDTTGETQRVFTDFGLKHTAKIDDAEDIAQEFCSFVEEVRNRSFSLPDQDVIAQYSRRQQVMKLSALFREISSE